MSKNPTVKEVSARVEQLALEFKTGLDSFKNEIAAISPTPVTSAVPGDFIVKFQMFESMINSSLAVLQGEMKSLKENVELIERESKRSQARQLSNVIVMRGINENVNDLYDCLLDIFNNKLKITDINKRDINYCYRIGFKNSQNKKPRPLAVQFCTKWIRDQVFFNKKHLKGSQIFITEMLTQESLDLFKKVREVMGKSSWTFNGRIYASVQNKKMLISSESDLYKLSNPGGSGNNGDTNRNSADNNISDINQNSDE
ncbi:unnamed protein product [Brassicogethes aeneus]|uniref:Uncharacterized protein n=1 Tax=Brassicogethes aeneus TaxID=1431903 RepID=A0A9P0FH94_BRAAE|nr:unnamed protein product [Brassicogethes aeneus]